MLINIRKKSLFINLKTMKTGERQSFPRIKNNKRDAFSFCNKNFYHDEPSFTVNINSFS